MLHYASLDVKFLSCHVEEVLREKIYFNLDYYYYK